MNYLLKVLVSTILLHISIGLTLVSAKIDIGHIKDLTISENEVSETLSFTITSSTIPYTVAISCSSQDESIISASNIIFSGPDVSINMVSISSEPTHITLLIQPETDRSGTVGITITIKDQSNIVSSESFMVTVTVVNSPPELSFEAFTNTYIEDSNAIRLVNNVFITDNDDSEMSRLEVTIKDGYDVGNDILACSDTFGLSSQYKVNEGMLIINGTIGRLNYAQILKSITYRNISQDPLQYTRTIAFNIFDCNSEEAINGIQSSEKTITIFTQANNDPPTITSITNVSILEDQSIEPIIFKIDDPDNINLVLKVKSENPFIIPDNNICLETETLHLFDIITILKLMAKLPVSDINIAKDIFDDMKIGFPELMYSFNYYNSTPKDYILKIIPLENIHGSVDILITVSDPDGLSTVESFNINLSAVADQPSLSLQSNTFKGREDEPVPIFFNAQLKDNDGSEELFVLFSDIPEGLSISQGSKYESTDQWIVPQVEFVNLQFIPPKNKDGKFELSMQALSKELSNNDRAFTQQEAIQLIISGVPDPPMFQVDEHSPGTNEAPIPLTIYPPYLTDNDNSESLSQIKISGMPEESKLSAGKDLKNGSWLLTIDQLDKLKFIMEDMDEDKQTIELEVSVSSTENHLTATTIKTITIEMTKQRLNRYGDDTICFISTISNHLTHIPVSNLNYSQIIAVIFIVCTLVYLYFNKLVLLSIFLCFIFLNFQNAQSTFVPRVIEINFGPSFLDIDESNAANEFTNPPKFSIEDSSFRLNMNCLYKMSIDEHIYSEFGFDYIFPVSGNNKNKNVDIDVKLLSIGCKWNHPNLFNYKNITGILSGGLAYIVSREKISYHGTYKRDDQGLGLKFGAGLAFKIKNVPVQMMYTRFRGFDGVDHIRSVDSFCFGSYILLDRSKNYVPDPKPPIQIEDVQIEKLLQSADSLSIVSYCPKEYKQAINNYQTAKLMVDIHNENVIQLKIEETKTILTKCINSFFNKRILFIEERLKYIDKHFELDALISHKQLYQINQQIQKEKYISADIKSNELLKTLDTVIVNKETKAVKDYIQRITNAAGHNYYPKRFEELKQNASDFQKSYNNETSFDAFERIIQLKKESLDLIKRVANKESDSFETFKNENIVLKNQSIIAMDITDSDPTRLHEFQMAKKAILSYLKSIQWNKEPQLKKRIKFGTAQYERIRIAQNIAKFETIQPSLSADSNIKTQLNNAFTSYFNDQLSGPKKLIYIISQHRSQIAPKHWDNVYDFDQLLKDQKSFNCIIVGSQMGDGFKRLTEKTGGYFRYADTVDKVYNCLKDIIEKKVFCNKDLLDT